jgi:hypothetical protein
MKSLRMLTSALFCVSAMTACAVDVQPQTTEDQSSGTAEVPKIVQVSPEQSFAQPEGTFEGNDFTANACHVELLFCRDSRAMNLPSLCHNGCTETQALNAARSLCLQICGHINCNTLADFGGC